MSDEANLDIVTFTYKNHKGMYSGRVVRPIRIWFGSTTWYPEPQWLLEAFDLHRLATRDFAMSGIHEWKVVSEKAMDGLRDKLTVI